MNRQDLPIWATEGDEEVIWLDGDHALIWYNKGKGAFYWHRKSDGNWCVGSFRIGKQWWQMEQEDPLTLLPSLLCYACGDHGWIRDGKWVKV